MPTWKKSGDLHKSPDFWLFLKHWPHRDSIPTWQQLATIAQWQSISCVIRWGLGTIVSGCWGQAKKLPLIIVLALFLLILKEKIKYFSYPCLYLKWENETYAKRAICASKMVESLLLCRCGAYFYKFNV